MSKELPELAMDYFDTLTAQRYDMHEDQISEFLGLNLEEDFDQNQIAMQSIPLYCPACVYDTYCEKYKGIYQDPFMAGKNGEQDPRASMPYLSLIEVFITPEVIARLDRSSALKVLQRDCFDLEKRPSLRIYNSFYRDLHLMMEGFLEEGGTNRAADEKFIFCIYESVSIGDFAVVIRSSRPETAFRVTTLLRKRACELRYLVPQNKGEDDPDNLVLYKTFTIFSLNAALAGSVNDPAGITGEENTGGRKNRAETETAFRLTKTDIISPEDEEAVGNPPDDSSCRYVIRGVLSNRYWSYVIKAGKGSGLNDTSISHLFHRLHGRYDFTVTISERAFRSIHPILIKYKLDRNLSLPKNAEGILANKGLSKDEEKICRTLIRYIQHHYISYINERYLFGLDTSTVEVRKCNENISLLPVNEKLVFSNDLIEGRIQILKQRIRKERARFFFLNSSRSSHVHNMKLLEKLANICSEVNGISDARIYSLVIQRQIEAVLTGIDEYLDYIDRENALSFIEHLDHNLKTALESINSFAQFILENSMQSFQTPIYNLESHVSVEKMLTGYSWFLQSILKWFEESGFSSLTRGNIQKYLTVMVPDALDRELSTQSVFYKLDDRKSLRGERLLTVNCPSFTDMTDFTGTFGTLFHELGHYLRFEPRYDRNRVILKYSTMLLFDQTAKDIASDFENHISGLQDIDDVQSHMIVCFAEAYHETYYQKKGNFYSIGNTNLIFLIQRIKKNYRRFVDRVHILSKFEVVVNNFLNHPPFIIDSRFNSLMDCMKKIRGYLFQEKGLYRNPDEFEELLRQGADMLDKFYCSSQFVPNETSDTGEQFYLARLLKNISGLFWEIDSNFDAFLEECADIRQFYRRAYDYFMRYMENSRENSDSRKIYSYLFAETFSKDDRFVEFRRFMAAYIVNSEAENLELFENMLALYREVASDLYLVKALNLTPFGFMNYFIRHVPMEERLGDTYVERFCRVLYAIRGEDVSMGRMTWREVFADIFTGICHYLVRMSTENTDRIRLIQMEMGKGSHPAIADNHVENMINSLGLLSEACDIILERAEREPDDEDRMNTYSHGLYDDILIPLWESSEQIGRGIYESDAAYAERHCMGVLQKCLGDFKHSLFLCKAFSQIVEEFHEKRKAVERFPFLVEDLFDGNRNLEQMYLEFRESDLMKYYCSKVGQEYNEAGTAGSAAYEARDDSVWKIDFIMDMHYSMIWDYASKILNG